MKWLPKHAWAGLAIFCAVVLRLYDIHAHPHIMGDALVYGDLATNLLKHHAFGLTEADGLRFTLIRLPGYPLLIAACFSVFGIANYTSLLLLQLLIDVATCILLAVLATRLMGRRAGICALWLSALCPFTALYVAAGYTETVSIFCIALAFLSLERWQARHASTLWLCTLAPTLSFACLLRPDRTLLAATILCAMAWLAWNSPQRRRRLSHLAITCVVILLPLTIWTARNWHTFHVFQPLAPRFANDPGELVYYGFQRWYRTWAIDFKSTDNIYWNFDGDTLSIDDLPTRAFDSPQQRSATAAIFDDYNKTVTANLALDARFAQLAAERVHQHPLRYYVLLPIARVANMWLRPRTELIAVPLAWWSFSQDPLGCAKAAAFGLINLAYLALAANGLWRWRRQGWSSRRALGYAIVAFILLRSAMLLTMDNSEARYTMDCYPLVILLASFSLAGSRRGSHSAPEPQ